MNSDTPVADQTDHPGEPIAVTAAGALPWRVTRGSLEVLLIHRPKYDDWSWPKGKLDVGETIPECASREIREEIGLEAPLGIPLPPTHYHVAAGLKVVHYWAMRVNGSTIKPDGDEVDAYLWAAPDKAARFLSNPTDLAPLQALEKAHLNGELETWPLILVRHAKAKPRSSWTKAEGSRPLAVTGLRQAVAVERLLGVWRPGRVISSPWTRCVSTIAPYARSFGAKVKLVDALTEHSHQRSPKKAAAVVEGLFDKQRPAVVCTHRPVLPTMLKALAEHMGPELAGALPTQDPYLAPGEMIVCHVAQANSQRVVAVEQIKAFDD
ncbi:NUDIX hydrolase [Arthrobacter sp. NyZ413]|uniref:NUDIX hydrolase n=1 Tax=Arthrobacter sp. NyZ413 TaxID=3144669 RepID=UPI003BF77D4B